MELKEFSMRIGDDFHCHLRRGDMLGKVLPFTASMFGRAVVMPNTEPPILDRFDPHLYYKEIHQYKRNQSYSGFSPIMTIQINESTSPSMIEGASLEGVAAGKVYPIGVTTNSANGVRDFGKISEVFKRMQETGMLLLLHGEKPDTFCLHREKEFLNTLLKINKEFPELKIVLEHITTRVAVWAVKELKNVAATITAHHLLLTLDDVVGDLLSPHNFCKPIAKSPKDRLALLEVATSGNPKFFFGSDSAPHLKERKECSSGCAGIFSAPVAVPLLVEIFEKADRLDKLENFVSTFGAVFYDLPLNKDKITLVKKDWIVPESYDGIVPFLSGKKLSWQVK
ncbi:MAG: Dihydroorotase [Parcubacteria group bacterium GW2011_GWA1_40_21]|nr:MAG: Dihydroorotase [Parcubacteria group bacterium GW2011_GWC1_40_13]KKR53345.1 MAG: Dihydroorotase [Parcubacteria group bacterium GW2011_GWA1_40_21]